MGYPRAVHYAAALALALPFSPSYAALPVIKTGGDLKRVCQSSSSVDAQRCIDFVAGMLHGVTIGQVVEARLCLPDRKSYADFASIVSGWIAAKDEREELEITGAMTGALMANYACPQK